MRRPLVAGNWKMNLDLSGGRDLVAGIRDGLHALDGQDRIDVAVCPPAVYLFPVANAIEGSPIQLGAQHIYHETEGAFTGEMSAEMVADVGAKYAIIGHSERRHTIGHLEDDRMMNRQVRAALRAGLTPILCVGETLAEREASRTLEVLTFQLVAGLIGIELDNTDSLVIAYEPVWAIGTGETATPEQAQEAQAHLRAKLREIAGPVAEVIRILYGGSVKPDNAGDIMAHPDVDGGLIGGASLKADSFLRIAYAALETVR